MKENKDLKIENKDLKTKNKDLKKEKQCLFKENSEKIIKIQSLEKKLKFLNNQK